MKLHCSNKHHYWKEKIVRTLVHAKAKSVQSQDGSMHQAVHLPTIGMLVVQTP